MHRSGTSILYKMLDKTENFNIVKSYYILNYNELLFNYANKSEKKAYSKLENIFKNKGIDNRKIDNMEITPDYAQEYVYLLERKNYPNKLNEDSYKALEELCKKINYISNNNKPILLKNPYDFDNFLFLKNKYPNAKFIFIHREPLETISSNLRGWQVLYRKKNPYLEIFSPNYKKAFENKAYAYASKFVFLFPIPIGLFLIINRAKNVTNYFLKNLNKLDSNDYINITYENLCKNPNNEINKILNFLKLKSDIDFNKFIRPRKLEKLNIVTFFKKYIKRKLKSYYIFLEKLK